MSGAGAQVKVIIRTGGRFVKSSSGSSEYQGGETRLMQLPEGATYADVIEALDRLAGSSLLSAGSESSAGSVRAVLCELFGEPIKQSAN